MRMPRREKYVGHAVGYIVFHDDPDISYYTENPEYRVQRREMLRMARTLRCRLRRAPVEHLWRDGRGLLDRPRLAEVVKLVREDRWRVLVVHDLANLGLGALECALLMQAFREWKTRVWEASSGCEMTANPSHWEEIIAAGNPDDLRRAVVDLNELKKRATRLARETRTGRKPFGTLPGESETLKRIWELRRKRPDGSRLSYHAIADRLNAEERRTRQGKRWYARTVQGIIRRTKPHLDRDREPEGPS